MNEFTMKGKDLPQREHIYKMRVL